MNDPLVDVFFSAEVFERGLAVGFSTGAEYLQLWTAYIDYLRRGVEWDQGKISTASPWQENERFPQIHVQCSSTHFL